ncbi:hypothetical protein B0H12DRAFT_228249 [Mycena haematopus]|nr:hypothetical protein B0H12DRAFT_228249 [Mycena haematopus]
MPVMRTRVTRLTDISPDSEVPIISPTPRAFTNPFVPAPTFTDSSSSPSSVSKGEDSEVRISIVSPTPRAFTFHPPTPRAFSTFPSHDFTDSPSSSPPSASKGDDEYVRRPENAFILFRRWARTHADSLPAPTPPTQKEISMMYGL